MIVGGYTMDLYCDAPRCTARNTDIYGSSLRDAKREARTKGWSFSRDGRECFCATHKGSKGNG
jgi:hypothetical protein